MAAVSDSWRSKLNIKYSKTDIESWDAKLKAELKAVRQRAENKRCLDCGAEDVTWASPKLGIFMCVVCSDVHRAAGAHITCVKNFNTYLWGPDEVALMTAVGNRRGREPYGLEMVSPDADKNAKVAYRTRKYGSSNVQKLVAKEVAEAKANGASGPCVTVGVQKPSAPQPGQPGNRDGPDFLDDLFKAAPSVATRKVERRCPDTPPQHAHPTKAVVGPTEVSSQPPLQNRSSATTAPISNAVADSGRDCLEDFLAACNPADRNTAAKVAADDDLFAGWESWN